MSNNALQTIINAQLPGKEGLWQIHLHDGKISAIDAPVSYTHLDVYKRQVDGQSLRTYRHAPNTGTRKSWAAGDATSRAVRLR